MKAFKSDTCYRIQYVVGGVIDFRTQSEIPLALHMTRVKLRNKRIVYLIDLILEPYLTMTEVKCEGILAEHLYVVTN